MSSTLLEPHPRQRSAVPTPAPMSFPDPPASQSEFQELLDAFRPTRLRWNNLDWVIVVWVVVMHAGCLAAPFFFSWSGLAACVLLHWLTCSIGVCLGYHRWIAHKSLKLRKPAEFFALACGSVSAEGSPLTWAAVHRLHHQLSDQEGDPHSPLDGKWWSHLLWMFVRRSPKENELLFRRYVPELVDDPMFRFFERSYKWWLIGSAAAMLAVGWLLGGWYGGLSMLLWGICLRMVVGYHSTWFVNSATHLWGYRNYDTRDQSRNLWWVAVLAYGEGWHNNHHAHPSLAPAGHRWWEFDMTWWTIRLWRTLGLAYNVKDRIPAPRSRT